MTYRDPRDEQIERLREELAEARALLAEVSPVTATVTPPSAESAAKREARKGRPVAVERAFKALRDAECIWHNSFRKQKTPHASGVVPPGDALAAVLEAEDAVERAIRDSTRGYSLRVEGTEAVTAAMGAIVKPRATLFERECRRCACTFQYKLDALQDDYVACPNCSQTNLHLARPAGGRVVES